MYRTATFLAVALLNCLYTTLPVSAQSSSAGSTATSSSVAAGPTISLKNPPNSTLDASAFAIAYALPLIQFVNQTQKVFAVVNGTNKINTQAELASLSSAAVVKPNVDTLYSRVIVDLSQHDLVLTVPNITDRFWIFPFYDIFGNNFANIDPVNGSSPGQYLIRRADDALVQPGLQVTNVVTADNIPKYQGIVNYPTTYGTILIRILLKYNTTENLDIVHKYQSEYNITATPRTLEQPNSLQAPELTIATLNGSLTGSPPEQLLQLLARIAPYNQPEIASERYRVASILGLAGVVAGKYIKPTGVNITEAYAIAENTITAVNTAYDNINHVGNGWQLGIVPFEGNFGVNYEPRAYIAATGYQQLVPYITLYPGWEGPSFRSYNLAPNTSYLFTFSGKPPVESIGFWSLTIYGADQYLIPNSLNRFEVGDRSNLTYADGSPVYGASAKNTTTTPFQVLMQPADIAPPKNWTTNWLPAPPGGGDLSFILRWYVPTNALTNGSYVYPVVETIAPIT